MEQGRSMKLLIQGVEEQSWWILLWEINQGREVVESKRPSKALPSLEQLFNGLLLGTLSPTQLLKVQPQLTPLRLEIVVRQPLQAPPLLRRLLQHRPPPRWQLRSVEHTSELQSQS